MADSKRIESFDILKGAGILLVILGHMRITQSMEIVIYSFHMPLFFIVSGCFFRNISWRDFARKKGARLLVPWLFFVFLRVAYMFLLNFYESRSLSEAILAPLHSMMDGLAGNEHSFCLFHTIWFLVCLLEVSLLYLIIHKLTPPRRFRLTILTLICLIAYAVGYILQSKNIDVPFFGDTTMSVLIYYHLGWLFMQNKLYQRHISPSIALIGLFVSITFVTLLAPHVELAYNIYPVYLLVISTAILLCLFWLIHAYFNRDNRCSKTKGVLIWCGTNSLAIFGIHQLITDTFEILENKLSFESYCWTFLEFLICVAICYAATSFINKRIPWALGKI